VVDVRILAATNRDLAHEVKAGAFRADLYFRLSAFPLLIPSLRERLDELPALARKLLADACAERDRPAAQLTEEALAAIVAHDWPGNVRELKSVVARALLHAAPGAMSIGAREIARSIDARPAARGAVATTTQKDDERGRILAALERHGGNQTAAAAELHIARRTLLYKLDKLGITRPRKRT
jgi:DNA-binding NtrC family response regulator